MVLSTLSRLWNRTKAKKSVDRSHIRSRQSSRTLLRLDPLEERDVPATFYVTNFNDSGTGSLRQAIIDSNNVPGPTYNTIEFPTTGNGIVIINLLSQLDPFINHTTINGPTAYAVVLNRVAETTNYRIIDHLFPAYDVVINNLTITNGQAENGGGIRNRGGELTLNNVTIQGCTATNDGGAIYNTGTLTLNDCFIGDYGFPDPNLGNSAGRDGGGIASIGDPSSHIVTIDDSIIVGNTAGRNGGGISSIGGNAQLDIYDSGIDSNIAGTGEFGVGNGGGIYHVNGQLNVIGGSVTNNFALPTEGSQLAEGGGIYIENGVNSTINTIIFVNVAGTYGGLFVTGTQINLSVNLSLIYDNMPLDTNL